MSYAVFLKDQDGWFLFKVFNNLDNARDSQGRWLSKGFDCVLVFSPNANYTADLHKLFK